VGAWFFEATVGLRALALQGNQNYQNMYIIILKCRFSWNGGFLPRNFLCFKSLFFILFSNHPVSVWRPWETMVVVWRCCMQGRCNGMALHLSTVCNTQMRMDISHSRQDPSNSDDDITQYMQHSLLWPMPFSPSSILFTFVQPFCFVQYIASIRADHLQTRTPLADSQEAWLSSMVSWPWPDLWHLSLWRKCGECSGKKDNRDPKGDKVPIRDNRVHLWKFVFKRYSVH